MDDVKKLLKLLESIGNKTSQGSWACFNQLLDVSLEATKRAKVFDISWQPDMGDFANARQEFIEAYAVFLSDVYPQETYQDIIGTVYMELGVADKKHFGQFFTPWNVARMMAQMVIAQPDLNKYTPQRPMTICDPCCGSGIMLLAAASVLPRDFIDEGRVVFYGIDIDPVCVKMAQLNASLYGLDHPLGFVKPTGEVTQEEVNRLPEPYKQQVQQTLFELDELKKAA
jgi:type I restriction-modification system DNA methylase subunit